jgi:hypothetical protein
VIKPDVRRLSGNLLIDHRGIAEVIGTAALVGIFVLVSGGHGFESTLDAGTRAALYSSLAGTSAGLLGFVLAALAILVALPSSDRLEALRLHPKWPRVPSAYLRAARALLAALVLCTLGIAIDHGVRTARLYESASVAALGFALVRVTASVVALDQVMAVARTPNRPKPIDDP